MDNEGRPVEGILSDNQEIMRRYQIENPDDLNKIVEQKQDPLGLIKKADGLEENDRIAYVKGEKTICCWNCQSILMVKDEWSVVQCTNCEKINKIPGADDSNNKVRINDNLNHFEIHLPYVFVIITCPFCRTENKARKDAEHMICFKCHNSVSIQHDPKIRRNQDPYNNYNNFNSYNQPYNQYNQPIPNNSQRANDIFFPQPPPNYSNPYFNNYNPLNYGSYGGYRNPYMPEPIDRQMEDYIRAELLKRKYEKHYIIKNNPRQEKYGALSNLFNTVQQISETRSKRGTPQYQVKDYDLNKYNSPLKSESIYKNVFSKNCMNNYESYQDYKRRDKYNFDNDSFFFNK